MMSWMRMKSCVYKEWMIMDDDGDEDEDDDDSGGDIGNTFVVIM